MKMNKFQGKFAAKLYLFFNYIWTIFNQTFLIGYEHNDGYFFWQAIQPVLWFGGTEFPPNEPLCGYLGKADICQDAGKKLQSDIMHKKPSG
jgi:hypothetical protein